MKLKYLLAAVSPLALVMAFAVPGTASAQSVSTLVTLDKDIDVVADVDYDNKIDVKLEKHIKVKKDIEISGAIDVDGDIDVDAWAGSTIDGKQFVNDNFVELDDDVENLLDVSGSTSVIEDVDGNVGLNIALGWNNAQGNEVAIAAVSSGDAGLEAEVFKFQEILYNDFDNDDNELSNSLFLGDTVIDNVNGNVGLNIALGAFNTQENSLAIAVTESDSVLAEATVGVIQEVAFNSTDWDGDNELTIEGPFITSSDGNIGVNIALGVGNAQFNGLAVSVVDN